MKKYLYIFALTFTFSMMAGVTSEPFIIPRASHTPEIDGVISLDEWTNALCIDDFRMPDSGENAPCPTKAYLLYDSTAIYLAIRCETGPEKILAEKYSRDDDKIILDDSVEFMLSLGSSKNDFMRIVVNAANSIFDEYRTQGGFVADKKWNAEILSAVKQYGQGWCCEVKIPYYTFDTPGNAQQGFHFNLARNFAKDKITSTVSGTEYKNVNRFPALQGFDVDFTFFAWDFHASEPKTEMLDGFIVVKMPLTISNLSDKGISAKVEYVLFGDNAAFTSGHDFKFKSRETCSITLDGLKVKQPGIYECYISIVNPETRMVLSRKKSRISIKNSVLKITLKEPSYRNMLFATQKYPNVIYTVNTTVRPENLTGKIVTGIKDSKGNVLVSKSISTGETISFPAQDLPDERMTIFAELYSSDGTLEDEHTHPLRKLPYHKGEVWRGKDGNWYVDGKTIFIMAEWIPKLEHVLGTNATTSNYPGTLWINTDFMMEKIVDTGIYKRSKMTEEDETLIREKSRKIKNDENLFAYFLIDEPEISSVTANALFNVAEILRDEDPYHPIIIAGLGSTDFASVAELNALHPYPRVIKSKLKNDFEKIVRDMNLAIKIPRAPTVIFLQQGFNYGDNGHQDARVPNYDEIRTQFIMAQILGAKGFMLFNRRSPYYPELCFGVPELVKEFNVLAPVFIEDDVISDKIKHNAASGSFAWVVKKHNNHIWIFAVSLSHEKQSIQMDIPELSNSEMQVVSEARAIKPENGRFIDTFDNFQVHIYTTDMKDFKLRSVKEIEATIIDMNEAKRKQGNLLFQMFEEDSMKVTASSNKNISYLNKNNCLWHITDGITEINPSVYGSDKLLWITPHNAKLPHWLELNLYNPIQFNEVIINQCNESLRDYKIQIWEDNIWKTICEIKNARGKKLVHSFSLVENKKLRLYVTAVNGKELQISEIEAYKR